VGGLILSMLSMLSMISMLNKRIYNKVIAISEEDMLFIRKLKEKHPKKSLAGINSFIINLYKKNNL